MKQQLISAALSQNKPFLARILDVLQIETHDLPIGVVYQSGTMIVPHAMPVPNALAEIEWLILSRPDVQVTLVSE